MTATLSYPALTTTITHLKERLPEMGDSDVEAVRAHLNKLDLWVAAHDARIDAYWDAQHNWNAKIDTGASQALSRISSIERKMMWWAGFAAAAGSVVGSLIGRFL